MNNLIYVWNSWQEYNSNSKILAMLLVFILAVWLLDYWKKEIPFFVYTALMTTLMIIPVTALVFMGYQTQFYDYRYIWDFVPVVAFCAYAGTEIAEAVLGNKERKRHVRMFGILLLIGMIAISGKLFLAGVVETDMRAEYFEVEDLLSQIEEDVPRDRMVIWGPQNVMKYARMANPECRLYYGRNMWESPMDAYCYDELTQSQIASYQWMEDLQQKDYMRRQEIDMRGYKKIKPALKFGVNVLLLPQSTPAPILQSIENRYHLLPKDVQGYYFFDFYEYEDR